MVERDRRMNPLALSRRTPAAVKFLCDNARTWQASWLKLWSWLAGTCRPFTGIRYQEQVMSMNKVQVNGRVNESEGKIKEIAGKLVGNESLEAKGKVQKILGEAQAKLGDVKQDMRDMRHPKL
jgi:uncharacterized protein YjbJ (UPF0337 family)